MEYAPFRRWMLGLRAHPRILALARALIETPEFRAWAASTVPSPAPSPAAAASIAFAALIEACRSVREFARGDGAEHEFFVRSGSLEWIDSEGCPGLGAAMESVGLAKVSEDGLLVDCSLLDAIRPRPRKRRSPGGA